MISIIPDNINNNDIVQNKNNKSPVIKQTGFEIFGGNSKAKDDHEVIKTSLEIFKKSKYFSSR